MSLTFVWLVKITKYDVMKSSIGNIHDRTRGESEKEGLMVEVNVSAEFSKEKEIVETLTYKLGISEDELFTYIDDL